MGRRKGSKQNRWCCSAAAVLVAAISPLALPSGAAHAQAIDYGSLESLFGEPVTTSVTGSPQRASDVPASMIILTADDIRRSGARDIPGILRHVPGVDVQQWTNDSADVAVRGYNRAESPRLLVLVNGRQVYADFYGYTPWSTLPIELVDIRQIEIVEGPNCALFGFNAVGGVINIVTYDPLYDDVNTASVTGGTQNLIQGSAVVTHRWDGIGGVQISLGGRSNDDFTTPQQPIDLGARHGANRKAINVLAHVQLGPDIDASLELSHSESDLPEFEALYATFYAKHRVTSIKAHIAADSNAGLISATAYANFFQSNLRIPTLGAAFQIRNPVYVAQLQDILKPAPAHTVRISFEYRYNDMATANLRGAHVFYDVIAGGAMWSWTIDPDLTLTNAIRIDHLSLGRTGIIPLGFGLTNADWNKISRTEISFNSGAVWQYDSDDTFRLTVARGIQLPNLSSLGGLLQASPFGYMGGVPTLKPTVVMNYELGWDHKISDWNAQLRIRAFHQTTKDILADFGGSAFALGLLSTPANIGNSEATGVELSLRGTFAADWHWGASYTPEWISDHFLPGLTVVNTLSDYQHTHPVHVMNANLGWSHGPWEADVYLRYESEFRGIRPDISGLSAITGTLVRIPGYVSMDARIAYRLTDSLTLALSGQNLLQSPQTQTSAPQVERRIYLTASVDF